jgi:hypothetical protein
VNSSNDISLGIGISTQVYKRQSAGRSAKHCKTYRKRAFKGISFHILSSFVFIKYTPPVNPKVCFSTIEKIHSYTI